MGNIWSDDVAELFLSAPGAPYPYIHIAINAKGIYRVQLNTGHANGKELKNFDFRTRGSVGKDEWSVEATIPVKLLSSVTRNGKMQLGICRSRSHSGKRKAQLSTVQKSRSGGFHSEGTRFTVQFR